MGARGRPNPLMKPKVRNRGLSAGIVGLAMTASTFLGAGTAQAADMLIVDKALAIVDAEAGQQVAVAPSTMDFKVREAVLLAIPLAFGPAKDASKRFAALSPIPIGTASEGSTFYSGKDIAKAAGSRLSEIGLPEDKVDSVRTHFTNLVSLGNAVTVRVPKNEEEPPPPPSSSEKPAPPPDPTTGKTPPPAPRQALPPPDPAPALPQPGGAPTAMSILPPDLRGSALTWAQGSYGKAPGMTPNVGDLVQQAKHAQEQQQAREQQDEVRAAGKAEALPTEVTERVAVPVLLASIALAVATAALVRSWVLRRQ